MGLSILIVEDHPLMATALAGVLKDIRPQVDCHFAVTGVTARRALAEHADLGLVALDLTLPDEDGFALLAHVRERYPAMPVMVVSASDSAENMRRALAAGASAYVIKSAPPATLVKAAVSALRGEQHVPAMLLQRGEFASAGAVSAEGGLLNPRQLDVLRLLCAGKSNKFIAYELGLAEKTVKGRITAIFKALDVDNRTQALLKASRLGLVSLGGHPPDEARPAGLSQPSDQAAPDGQRSWPGAPRD